MFRNQDAFWIHPFIMTRCLHRCLPKMQPAPVNLDVDLASLSCGLLAYWASDTSKARGELQEPLKAAVRGTSVELQGSKERKNQRLLCAQTERIGGCPL